MTPLQAELHTARQERLVRMGAWSQSSHVPLARIRPASVAPIPRGPDLPAPAAPPEAPKIETWFRIIEELAPARLTVALIQKATALHYGVRVEDICSARRTANVMRPRMVAAWLSRMLTPNSLPEIGRRFGKRDHSTILHSYQKVSRDMDHDPEFRAEVMALFDRLKSVTAAA